MSSGNAESTAISAASPKNIGRRMPAAWTVGFGMISFGLVVGFTITALPYLLTKSGIAVDRVATVSATVMSPTFWGFLLNPLLDSGLTRRTYCWITIFIAAVCLGLALWLLSPAHLSLVTALLLAAELSIVLFASAVSGWTAEFVPESKRGAVGGWVNVANLGGGALGSMAVMFLASRVPVQWLGLGLAIAVLTGCLPLVYFPRANDSSFALRHAFSAALRATWKASKRRECLTGFALFLAPAASVAAINLFSGLGKDFGVDAGTVIAVTGGGCALTASAGSLLGGWLSHHLPRGYVYIAAGSMAGLCALTLAFAQHNRVSYIVGVLVYNALAGVSYAAFTALGLQLVGSATEVASTQLGLFAAATNGAIVYMTWADGRGYHYFGVRGLLCVDAFAALASGIPLFFLLHRQLRLSRKHEAIAN
jgi:MFS family permease